jgi:hypothetical protein
MSWPLGTVQDMKDVGLQAGINSTRNTFRPPQRRCPLDRSLELQTCGMVARLTSLSMIAVRLHQDEVSICHEPPRNKSD